PPYLRDVVVLPRMAALAVTSRHHEDASIKQQNHARIPATLIHWRQRRPVVLRPVIDTGLVDARAVDAVAAGDEQPAVGEKGMSRAEQVDGRSVRHFWGTRPPNFQGSRIERVNVAAMLIHAGVVEIDPAAPE